MRLDAWPILENTWQRVTRTKQGKGSLKNKSGPWINSGKKLFLASTQCNVGPPKHVCVQSVSFSVVFFPVGIYLLAARVRSDLTLGFQTPHDPDRSRGLRLMIHKRNLLARMFWLIGAEFGNGYPELMAAPSCADPCSQPPHRP